MMYIPAIRALSVLLLLTAPIWLTACDSGDIYEQELDDDGEGFQVKASFSFSSTEVFPKKYLLLFGAFGEEKAEPLASVSIIKPAENKAVEVALSKVPRTARKLKLCLTSLGKQPIYSFFELDIDGTNTEDIDVPEAAIELMQYDRIQEQVFANCTSCHGSYPGAANLYLATGSSYSNLVGRTASRSSKLRVKSGSAADSFIMDVLTTDGLLSPSHTRFLAKEEDLALLRQWIESGAVETRHAASPFHALTTPSPFRASSTPNQ